MLTYSSYSGESLSIKASGVLLDTVEEGATVLLEVKYGLITLLKQQVDLCECPLEKGPLVVAKEVELPKEIPPVSLRRLYSTSCNGEIAKLTSWFQTRL